MNCERGTVANEETQGTSLYPPPSVTRISALDGSRSIYFNAARLDVFLERESRIILFYTYQPEVDNLLPVLNDQTQRLVEQPEKGFGFFFLGGLGPVDLDSYYIWKRIVSTGGNPYDSTIHTTGGRMVLPLAGFGSLSAEGAYQKGTFGPRNRSAYGGYAHMDFLLNGTFLEKLIFGGIYLSGDDPETIVWEGWDPLFSRWPKWSESYIYTLIREHGGKVAYWSNLASLYGSAKLELTPDIGLELTFHRLLAPQAAQPDAAFPGGQGHVRGHLFITKLNLKISQCLTGHFLWEAFSPGDYYAASADRYHWIRFELMYKI